MAKSFKLPDLGEGIHEGEIMAIPVSAGDVVKEGDVIIEVETDKAAVEIPSPYTGTVLEILAKVGDVVHVGDVLMTFDTGEAAVSAESPVSQEKDIAAKPAVSTPPPDTPKTGSVPASPATRRLAREMDVNLRDITPTGRGGVVTADDVRAFAAKEKTVPVASELPVKNAEPETSSPRPEKTPELRPLPTIADVPPLPDFSKWGPIERTPVRSIRRATARQMSLAWSQIPHVSTQDEIDITELEAFRQKHRDAVSAQGGRLTLTVFALKALTAALKAHPRFNSSLDTASGQIVLKKYYHIGVAADTEDGLIVPVIRDVDRKSIVELSVELGSLIDRTRNRKVGVEELQGGTFTVTNMGNMGGGHFTPMINYPQVAIFGMGRAALKPVVREKSPGRTEIVPRLMLPVVLAMDHRVLDGGDAGRFLKIVIHTLENPENLMLAM